MLNNILNKSKIILDLKVQAQSFLFVLGNSEKDRFNRNRISIELQETHFLV